MESYLKGRKQAHRFKAHLPTPKAQASPAGAVEETVIAAEAVPEALAAPDVDLVLRDGIVRRIIVHLPDGQRLELECDYGDGA